MQGRQPKIKSNMKKYSQFITFANCTTTNATLSNSSSSQHQAALSNSIATTNSNRILVEKQLASLSTNGNTPKIVKPAAKNGNAVMNNVKVVTKQAYPTGNNENVHVSTPHTKNGSSGNKHSTKTPKALFFDEIKVFYKLLIHLETYQILNYYLFIYRLITYQRRQQRRPERPGLKPNNNRLLLTLLIIHQVAKRIHKGILNRSVRTTITHQKARHPLHLALPLSRCAHPLPTR